MAGWLKKKRLGSDVSKLFEDAKPYGKAFHDRLFLEEMEDEKKKDKDMEECGDLDRIAQLTAPESGGSLDDDEYEGDDEEDGEDETEITVKIEKEEDEEAEADEENLEEGFIGDLLGILGVSPDELNVDLTDPRVKKELQDFLAKGSMGRIKSGNKPKGSGGPYGSSTMSKSVNLAAGDDAEVEDDEEEMEEAVDGEGKLNQILRSDVFEMIYDGLGSLVNSGTMKTDEAQGLLAGLVEAVRTGLGGESKELKKLRTSAKKRGNPLADETQDEMFKKEEKEDPEEMEEAFTLFKGVSDQSQQVAKDLMRRFVSQSGVGRKVSGGKTGIGRTAGKAKRRAEQSLAMGEEEKPKTQEELAKEYEKKHGKDEKKSKKKGK